MSGGTLADYGLLGQGPAVSATEAAFDSGAYTEASPDTVWQQDQISGLFAGGLSAQGNMVAMQLNKGGYKYVKTGRFITVTSRNAELYTSSTVEETVPAPYLTGYIRQYWRDPTTCTFGADSPMPAITGVMPASFTDMPGNLNYYLDLQMTRLSGSNYFNIFAFIGTLNQSIAWISTANNYLASLKKAESTNLAYYNAKNYSDLVSQGFDKYKKSKALVQALDRQGLLVQTLNSGNFGTPNAVAHSMLVNGLGAINNFAANLYAAGVNFDDIYNTDYTPAISYQLSLITNTADLNTIQEVLETGIRVFKSPLDYCSISASSGLENDSDFKDMGEFGKDIFNKSQSLTFKTGSELATFINNIQADPAASVESLATQTTLIPQSVIDNLRSKLPFSPNNNPVSLLNIIGTASGYLTDLLSAVNEGLAQLLATPYGPQIRSALNDISRYYARVPKDEDEQKTAEKYEPVPPPVETTTYDEAGNPTTTSSGGGPDYWQVNEDAAVARYYSILNQLAADTSGDIPSIVAKINNNYNELCTLLSYEYRNYNKANPTQGVFNDNNQILSFVQTLPSYGVDSQNIGTDTLLYGLAQPTSSGELLKTILGQAKNNNALGNAGVRVVGIL